MSLHQPSQESAKTADTGPSAQKPSNRDRLFERHRGASGFLPVPRLLAEHRHELAFEATFDLRVCFRVRIHHHAGVAAELVDGAAEPRGAVGVLWLGAEGHAGQGFGDVKGVRPCRGERQFEHLGKRGAGIDALPKPSNASPSPLSDSIS